MKKILALILTVCLAFSVAGVYASAETLDGIEDIATYTVPDATQYGQPWYVDEVGEYKLFDGEIPDANMLDAARDEAIKENPEIKDWYAWHGWIALAKTVEDAYEKGKSVCIDFRFEREVTLKEMIFHTAAMATGNVGNPTEYRIYVSEDGETYNREPVATIKGTGEVNEAKLAETKLTLDEAIATSYVRVVMDAPGAWVFVSEVEIYEDIDATDAVTAGEIIAAEPEEESSAPEESSEPEESSAASSEEEDDESSAAASEASSEEDEEESSRAASSAPASSAAASQADADDSGSMWVWIVIAAVAVVVIVIVAIVVSGKKKAE